jgi:hypothetical protein
LTFSSLPPIFHHFCITYNDIVSIYYISPEVCQGQSPTPTFLVVSSESVLQERRTHFGLSKVSTVSDDELKSIVEEAVMHVPSPFNMQSGRAVILIGEASDKLWLNVVLPDYLKLVGGDGEP